MLFQDNYLVLCECIFHFLIKMNLGNLGLEKNKIWLEVNDGCWSLKFSVVDVMRHCENFVLKGVGSWKLATWTILVVVAISVAPSSYWFDWKLKKRILYNIVLLHCKELLSSNKYANWILSSCSIVIKFILSIRCSGYNMS